MSRSPDPLGAANARRRSSAIESVEEAMAVMRRGRKKINVHSVARTAGVSRQFLYSQPDLLAAIRAETTSDGHRVSQTTTTSTEASLRSRLAIALDSIAEQRDEIKRLERRVENLTAQILDIERS